MNTRWLLKRSGDAPAAIFDPTKHEVCIIPQHVAKAFVLQHHYAGSFPAARLSVGLYRAGMAWLGLPELVGVCVFSVPGTQNVIPCYATNLLPAEGVELGRLVMLDLVEANGESWFVAAARRILREALPEVRFIISYSDPVARTRLTDGAVIKPGHEGIVYRALNATFFGRATARNLELAPDGTILNARTISKLTAESKGHLYAAEQVYRATGLRILQGESGASYWERARKTLRVIPHPGNYAYGWAFDKRVALAPSMPYPVRAK